MLWKLVRSANCKHISLKMLLFPVQIILCDNSHGHPPLTYRCAHVMVVHQLVARRTAAVAALLGRVLLAEMLTSSIIHRTVVVFDLWGKKKQDRRSWRAKESQEVAKWHPDSSDKQLTAHLGWELRALVASRALQTANRPRTRQWGDEEPRDYCQGRQAGEQKILYHRPVVEGGDDTRCRCS